MQNDYMEHLLFKTANQIRAKSDCTRRKQNLWCRQTVGNSYTLYTKALILDQGLFGPGQNHPMLAEMLGDYLAVANTSLTLFPNPSYLKFMKATHGGMTAEELTVPLIIWNS